MKQNRDWTDAVRDALRDAEIAPPAGGWKRLERELAPVPHMRIRRNPWLRIAAAAAAVLLLAVAGEWLWRPEQAQIGKGDVVASAARGGKTADNTGQTQTPAPVAEPEQALVAQTAPRTLHRGSYLTASDVTERTTVAEQPVQSAGAGPEEQSDTKTAEANNRTRSAAGAPSNKSASQTAASQAAASRRTAFSGERFVAHVPPRKTASLGLFAGGGVVGGNSGSSGGAQSLIMQSPSYDGNCVGMLAPRYDYAKGSFRHHQPLSLGLSVRKEFPYGLSLESGVVYTLLRSDVELFEGAGTTGQRLHMIGVPVRLNWQFLERGRFSLYIGAGGMAEKCVSASFGSQRVEEPGVQWSVVGAAGAQYRLGGLVGLYFEPEVSYYFTQTYLRTARTDSPLTLSLRLGVRLSF